MFKTKVIKFSAAAIERRDMRLFGGYVDKTTNSALLAGWTKVKMPNTNSFYMYQYRHSTDGNSD